MKAIHFKLLAMPLACTLGMLFGSLGYGETISTYSHTYSTEFAGPTASTGWSYLYNTGHAVGNSTYYVALPWYAANNQYNFSSLASSTYNETKWMLLSATAFCPGRSVSQGLTYDVCAIAAYTVQGGESGIGKIVSSSLTSPDATGSTTGVKVSVYVNNVLKDTVVVARNSTGSFDCDLGSLTTGDTVYVCLGANGDQSNNGGTNLNYTISIAVPEPATDMLLLGTAAGGLVVYGWKRKKKISG